MRSRIPLVRTLVLLAFALGFSAAPAGAAPAGAANPAARKPFVGGAEPGLSRLHGGEVLVALRDLGTLDLAANGRATARSAAVAAVLTRHGLGHYSVVGRGPRAGRYLSLTSDHADFDPRAAARELAATGAFRAVAPNLALRSFAVPNDPLIDPSFEWYVNSTTAGVSLPAAWDLGQGSPSTVIAIMDNGFDISHPDLASKVWTNAAEIPGNGIDDDHDGYVDDVHGWDFGRNDNDPSAEAMIDSTSGIDIGFHGTFVAGIAAAATNNGQGIAGAGWNCKFMPLKLGDAAGQMTLAAVTAAFGYMIDQGAAVLNMSFGTSDTTVAPYFQALVDDASAAGILCVAAAGNDGLDLKNYPAACTGVLSVGATDQTNARASFSDYGSWVKIAAPGAAMWSSIAQNYTPDQLSQIIYILYFGWDGQDPYMGGDGTSFSSPLVAGVCGLVRAKYPALSPAEVMAHVIHTGDVVAYDQPIGTRLNAYNALLDDVTAVDPVTPPAGTSLAGAWPNPFADATTIGFSISEPGPVRLSLYDIRGRLVRALIGGVMPAGRHTALWDGRAADGRPAASGVYFVVLERGGVKETRRIVLAR